jgi:hypothetical protein
MKCSFLQKDTSLPQICRSTNIVGVRNLLLKSIFDDLNNDQSLKTFVQ